MANYQAYCSFGDTTCASCAALNPVDSGTAVPGPNVVSVPGPAPMSCDSGMPWYLWLVIGGALGYLANE